MNRYLQMRSFFPHGNLRKFAANHSFKGSPNMYNLIVTGNPMKQKTEQVMSKIMQLTY